MEDAFRTSTRAMLEVVRSEKARLKKRMDELDEREKIILKWIEQEEGPQQQLLIGVGEDVGVTDAAVRLRRRPSLKDCLREVMQDGRPRSNAELAEIAKMRGVVSDDVDLRSINSTMLSLKNAGEFTRRDDKWVRLTKQEAHA